MKPCFSTLTCPDASPDEVIALLKKYNMDGIEIRLDVAQTAFGIGLDGADALRCKFADAGIAIIDLGTGVNVTGLGDTDAEMTKARGCVDLAAALGAGAIRIFVGGHQAHIGDVPREDKYGIVRFVRGLCTYAKEKNVEIWAETHSSHSTAAAMRSLADAVAMDNLRVIWDVLHSIEFRESPADSVAILGDLLAHVHLKDARPSEDADATQYIHTALGAGTMPLSEVLALLRAADYHGYLSLEWELPWRPELAGCYRDADATIGAYAAWLDRSGGN